MIYFQCRHIIGYDPVIVQPLSELSFLLYLEIEKSPIKWAFFYDMWYRINHNIVEPMVRIELTTCSLRVSRSAIEPHRRIYLICTLLRSLPTIRRSPKSSPLRRTRDLLITSDDRHIVLRAKQRCRKVVSTHLIIDNAILYGIFCLLSKKA